MFVATLSKYQFIPSLFNFSNTYGYRSANGKVRGDDAGEPVLLPTDDSIAGVRCVYDAWYWGEGQIDDNDKATTTAPATTWRGFFDNKTVE